jgi:hypothetical protein
VKAILVADSGAAGEIERLCGQQGLTLKIQVMPQLFVWPKRLLK